MNIKIFRGLWYSKDGDYASDEAAAKAVAYIEKKQQEKPPAGYARQVNMQAMSDSGGITFVVTVNDINLTAARLMAPPGVQA